MSQEPQVVFFCVDPEYIQERGVKAPTQTATMRGKTQVQDQRRCVGGRRNSSSQARREAKSLPVLLLQGISYWWPQELVALVEKGESVNEHEVIHPKECCSRFCGLLRRVAYGPRQKR